MKPIIGIILAMSSCLGTPAHADIAGQARVIDGDTIAIGTDEFRFELFGDFHEDSAIERKDLSVEQYQMTEQNNEDLNVRIDAAMKSAGGNLEVAAENLGLKPEVLKKVLDKRRDGPSKW